MAFMTHPQHGATNTQDVEGHKANGWKITTHEEWLDGKSVTGESPVQTGESPVRRKPGPKPKAE